MVVYLIKVVDGDVHFIQCNDYCAILAEDMNWVNCFVCTYNWVISRGYVRVGLFESSAFNK